MLRATFRYDGVKPLRVFVMEKYMGDGMAGDDFSSRKELNLQIVTSLFLDHSSKFIYKNREV